MCGVIPITALPSPLSWGMTVTFFTCPALSISTSKTRPARSETHGPISLHLSFDRCAFILDQIIGGLQQIFTGTSGDVAGPIGVARMAGTVAGAGITALFTFIALLSLNLGFLNLLPVPLLDGGLFLLTLLEAVYGKKLPEKSLYYIQALGVTVIAFLFLLAMFNSFS